MTRAEDRFRILVLEDDYHVQYLVTRALEEADFCVDRAASVEEALQNIADCGLPHLAIVDIKLRFGMSGIEFCDIIHGFSDLPIIMLSAVDEAEVIIQSIEQHAEDYVTKPFRTGELIARVRRVLHRIGNFAYLLEPQMRVDEMLVVDFQQQHVIVRGKTVSLTPTETKLLYILMRNAGETVDSSFILRRMWPLEEANKDRLRVCVYRLRQKLGKDKRSRPYIQSHRGVGYRFRANGIA